MENPDEVREIKEKLAKIDEAKKEMVVVRFKNLSPWLKTIVTLGWVIVLYFSILFVTGFIVGIQKIS